MTTQSIAATATLVHGFTMADVDGAARVAVKGHFMSRGLFDDEERREIAWHGAVVDLYVCGCGTGTCNRTTDLMFLDLVFAGRRELDRATHEAASYRGQPRAGAIGTAARWLTYWGQPQPAMGTVLPSRKPKRRHDDGFSEYLCEKLSLAPALATLTPKQYEAVATLAAFDNSSVQAAAALGMGLGTFSSRIADARKAIKVVWFEHETPPTRTNHVDACRSGHPRDEFGRQRKNGYWYCQKCHNRQAARARARNQDDLRAYHRTYKKHQRGDHDECLPEKCETAALQAEATTQ